MKCVTYKSGLGAFRQKNTFWVKARHARLRLTFFTAARASAAFNFVQILDSRERKWNSESEYENYEKFKN